MASFRIGPTYLVYNGTRYFRNGADRVKIGHIGSKSDLLGTFESKRTVPDIEKLVASHGTSSTVTYVSFNTIGGKGDIEFEEPTESVLAKLKLKGAKTTVVILEAIVTDILDGNIEDAIRSNQDLINKIKAVRNPRVVDTVVTIAKHCEMSSSEFIAKIKAGVTIIEMLKAKVGAEVSLTGRSNLTISSGTTLAYRLLRLRISKNGDVTITTRDHPRQ